MTIRTLGRFLEIPPFWLERRAARQDGGAATSVPNPYFGEADEKAGPHLLDHLELKSRQGGVGGSVGTQPTGGGNVPKPDVVHMPSPNYNSRDGAKIDTIVLHHTAGGGTAQDVGRFFQNRSAEVSSHYVVGKDGTIVQPVDDDKRAWHAGTSAFKGRADVNDFSIGIEIVNIGDGKDPYTDQQYKALAKLVLYLQDRYGIPWERITGHKDIALPRGRKTDPSANFSYDRLRTEVNKLQNGDKAKPAPAPAPAPAPGLAPQPGGTYTVRQGDSLSIIAKRVLGDGNRWREIYELNQDRINNPNLIYPGQVLKVPGATKPEPKPEPKPAPAPQPAPQPTPAPAPTPAMDMAQIQAQIAALQQQLEGIRTEIDQIVNTASVQLPRFLQSIRNV